MVGKQESDELDIFVPAIGQYENIGDIILRRQLLRWLRSLGRLHVFVGRSPAGYAEGLALSAADCVYRSFSSWYWAAIKASIRRRANYFFKPGEIQLTLAGLKEHMAVLPLVCFIRLRGGIVVRIGAGTRNFAWLPRLLMQPSLAIPNLTRWRDPATAAYLGGEVMPDLAFGEGEAISDMSHQPRDILVVSMRGDRYGVSEGWLDGVRRFAGRHGLRVHAVTQVHRDSALSKQLADALDGVYVGWDGKDHKAKEAELNAIYRRTLVAVSDRLHVLIAAFTHGAAPVGLQMDKSAKISRHFLAIGLRGVAHDCTELNGTSIEAILEDSLDLRAARAEALSAARTKLDLLRQEIGDILKGEHQDARVGD